MEQQGLESMCCASTLWIHPGSKNGNKANVSHQGLRLCRRLFEIKTWVLQVILYILYILDIHTKNTFFVIQYRNKLDLSVFHRHCSRQERRRIISQKKSRFLSFSGLFRSFLENKGTCHALLGNIHFCKFFLINEQATLALPNMDSFPRPQTPCIQEQEIAKLIKHQTKN